VEFILIGISTVVSIIGIRLWQKNGHLLVAGKKAKAIVIENNYDSSEGGGTYYPVVRFLTDKDVWITQQLNFGVNPAIKEGTRLEIIYDPEDPTRIQINSMFFLEVLPRFLLALGICGLTFAFLELFEITQLIGT
jgi:hypothetical protein